MALGYTVAARNNQLDELQILIDADVGAGNIDIYDGTRPANADTALSGQTRLARCALTDPVAPAASGGVLTFSAITDDTSTVAGTASWFRITDNSGDAVIDGDVGTAGSDLNLNSVTITTGGTLSITSVVITAGNA